MDFEKKLNRFEDKYKKEHEIRKSIERKLAVAEVKIKQLNSVNNGKNMVDITTTISAIHELRRINRKLDIYHVATITYGKEVGKFTSAQFMSRFHSGKNKFYEVISQMREYGYIDAVEVSYKRKRVYFYLTDKGENLYTRLEGAIYTAKKYSKINRLKENGKTQ